MEEMSVNEVMEIEGLKWEVRDLQMRIDRHNEERKALKTEKRELLKKIKETEKRYENNQGAR